ncbi:hypothetical protein M2302_004803 [Micromonospora sp. A200]|nr:hypothetical protein [Micromonospora sp. A200]MDH6464602.1 hypothetical protein [Micromonospora sp. A200]
MTHSGWLRPTLTVGVVARGQGGITLGGTEPDPIFVDVLTPNGY